MKRYPFMSLLVALMMGLLACNNANGDNKGANPSDVPLPPAKEAREQSDVPMPPGRSGEMDEGDDTADGIPLGAQALISAYPQQIKGYEDNKIIFTDGSTMVYDDGRKKGFEVMLDESDIEDMFWRPYVDDGNKPEYLADAGRSRCDALFKKMYGNSAGAVQSKLVTVNWLGQPVKFTSVNGAAEQLRKVAAELEKYPELRKYLKSSGTFYWRQVRGAKRMSAHSYGIAFDIGVPDSDYWLWKYPKAGETGRIGYANRFPHKIAEIFRKYGFIWGGAWYHFDTMHFEYRPEILRYADLKSGK